MVLFGFSERLFEINRSAGRMPQGQSGKEGQAQKNREATK
jgi:hypothetical protein